ncbi:T6SS effector BTH_I2691 family protein, partial [Pseudomonas sp. BCRC 81390]|uniref:T6SS effector BTH_I2691 family protein n=3 Tax=Pseudomonas sp. BCRC 81390 TaxID=3054778 RepID=UPI00259506C4
KNWQAMIDQVGKLYARHYAARAFQQIGYFDYDAADPVSVEYFIQMMAACLAGGPTEALPEQGQPLGLTQHVWQQLLEDDQSLLYQALLAKHPGLMQHVVAALSGDDFGKVYDIIKSIAGTDDGQLLVIKPIQDAVGQLLAATNSAGNALSQHLSERTRTLIGHVHRSAFALFAGQQVTPFRLSLTLGEYMSLLDEAVQARTEAFLQRIDQQFRDPLGRKVRAMVLSGAINIAAPGNRNQMIEVVLWAFESAESLQARLVQLREGAAGGVGALVRNIAIGAGTLRTQVTEGLKISSLAAQSVASDAMRSLRDATASGGSAGLLFALGSLWFHQDSLGRNYRALQETHQHNPEALAAIWSSSLGLLGVGVEVAGGVVAVVRPKIPWPGTVTEASLGKNLARYGGAITALAGVMDAAQYVNALLRTNSQGDRASTWRYLFAAGTATTSAVFGIYAALFANTLLGPLGIALVLGLAAYTLAMSAKNQESSPLELWSRHSRWGTPEEHRRWINPQDLDTSVGALNAAILGVQAHASIDNRLQSSHDGQIPGQIGAFISDGAAVAVGYYLVLHISLPNFSTDYAQYKWQLTVHQAGVNRLPLHLYGNSSWPEKIEYTPEETINVFADTESVSDCIHYQTTNNTLHINCLIPLLENHSANAIELTLTYWPNKNEQSFNATVTMRENRLSSFRSLFQ